MIPKIVHYCWFGESDLPQLAEDCMDSWKRYMPGWEYRCWNETTFDVNSHPYTKEAYEVGMFAFVSDYVRLVALEREGGIYLDVDFEVYKPFDDLLAYGAFAGFEGSKHKPVMMGVCGSVPHGAWVTEMLDLYHGRHFLLPDGKPDLTTNVQFITARMSVNGFRQDGFEQDYKDLHVLPVDFFCPRQTTGAYLRTENTYCEHRGLRSWTGNDSKWKSWVKSLVGQNNMIQLIKLKRKLFG